METPVVQYGIAWRNGNTFYDEHHQLIVRARKYNRCLHEYHFHRLIVLIPSMDFRQRHCAAR